MNSLINKFFLFVLVSVCFKISNAEEDTKSVTVKGDLNLAVFVILSQNHPRHAVIGNQVKV